jgi:hypothetical protein
LKRVKIKFFAITGVSIILRMIPIKFETLKPLPDSLSLVKGEGAPTDLMTGVEEVVQLLYWVYHHLHLPIHLCHNGHLILIIRIDLQHDTSFLSIALCRV